MQGTRVSLRVKPPSGGTRDEELGSQAGSREEGEQFWWSEEVEKTRVVVERRLQRGFEKKNHRAAGGFVPGDHRERQEVGSGKGDPCWIGGEQCSKWWWWSWFWVGGGAQRRHLLQDSFPKQSSEI